MIVGGSHKIRHRFAQYLDLEDRKLYFSGFLLNTQNLFPSNRILKKLKILSLYEQKLGKTVPNLGVPSQPVCSAGTKSIALVLFCSAKMALKAYEDIIFE